jgi:hypothetical protein
MLTPDEVQRTRHIKSGFYEDGDTKVSYALRQSPRKLANIRACMTVGLHE